MAYRLDLPPKLEKIHNVFHVSMLRRYRSDPSHVVSSEILARKVKELLKKRVPLVKVLWRNHKTEEAMWKSEEVMRQQYPKLFNEGNFEDEILLREEL